MSDRLEREYQRIAKHSRSDPGTAGDDCEQSWVDILAEMLPPNYRIVTKGRLINYMGKMSPQLDIIVLHPSYPGALAHKKTYFVEGVVAAFECKLTLRRRDLAKFMSNSKSVKNLCCQKLGTPYSEMTTPLIYGLLANRSDLKQEQMDVELTKQDELHISHPRECPDLICVATTATWVMHRYVVDPDCGVPTTSYMKISSDEIASNPMREPEDAMIFTPVFAFFSELVYHLAWEDASLRRLAGIFGGADLRDCGGFSRKWSLEVLSTELRRKLKKHRFEDTLGWDDWSQMI
jgi:hypothetical protein